MHYGQLENREYKTVPESSPGHLGKRRALSPLRHLCTLILLITTLPQLNTYVFSMFTLDPAYGDLTDYVYDKLNVTHSYGLELRPGENEPNGFLLPDCEIVPTGREIMAALKAITPILAKEIEEVEEDEKQNEKRRHAERRGKTTRNKTRRDE